MYFSSYAYSSLILDAAWQPLAEVELSKAGVGLGPVRRGWYSQNSHVGVVILALDPKIVKRYNFAPYADLIHETAAALFSSFTGVGSDRTEILCRPGLQWQDVEQYTPEEHSAEAMARWTHLCTLDNAAAALEVLGAMVPFELTKAIGIATSEVNVAQEGVHLVSHTYLHPKGSGSVLPVSDEAIGIVQEYGVCGLMIHQPPNIRTPQTELDTFVVSAMLPAVARYQYQRSALMAHAAVERLSGQGHFPADLKTSNLTPGIDWWAQDATFLGADPLEAFKLASFGYLDSADLLPAGVVDKEPYRQMAHRYRKPAKADRNASCHCGSGKKFKRCHG